MMPTPAWLGSTRTRTAYSITNIAPTSTGVAMLASSDQAARKWPR